MSKIQYISPVPDHVTRYTHKVNRWMAPPKPYHQTTAYEIFQNAVIILAFVGMLVTAVIIFKAQAV